jgi:hypothetical protein
VTHKQHGDLTLYSFERKKNGLSSFTQNIPETCFIWTTLIHLTHGLQCVSIGSSVVKWLAVGWMARLQYLAGTGVNLCATMFWQTLESNQPPMCARCSFPRSKVATVKPTNHLQLALRSRIQSFVPHHHTLPWCST